MPFQNPLAIDIETVRHEWESVDGDFQEGLLNRAASEDEREVVPNRRS